MSEDLLKDYKDFVYGVMSDDTKYYDSFIERLNYLKNDCGLDVQVLLTAGLGLGGEAGEVSDLIKKVIFHQKEYDQETLNKFKKELGDVMWYVTATAIAFDFDLDEVIHGNIQKLLTRYPGGKFDALKANDENKKE